MTRPGEVNRRRYSEAIRVTILAEATRKGLTAQQVEKRFGVKPATYYSWRRATQRLGKASVTDPRRRRADSTVELRQLRLQVRARVRSVMPKLIRELVSSTVGMTLARQMGRSAVAAYTPPPLPSWLVRPPRPPGPPPTPVPTPREPRKVK